MRAKLKVFEDRKQKNEVKAKFVINQICNFSKWLLKIGFKNLPDLPEIRITSGSEVGGQIIFSPNILLINEKIYRDSHAGIHLYLQAVIQQFTELKKSTLKAESAIFVEALIDYFVASYTNDPFIGAVTAKQRMLESNCLRNLNKIVMFDEIIPMSNKHELSVVLSGACWELRNIFGAEKMDAALVKVIKQLNSEFSIADAASLLSQELVKITDEKAKNIVKDVFLKRNVSF